MGSVLWQTDGTRSGTVQVATNISAQATNFTAVGNTLYIHRR
jgi:ELWxxDGT repeat protein